MLSMGIELGTFFRSTKMMVFGDISLTNDARYCCSYIEMNLTDISDTNVLIYYILLCAVKRSQRFHRDRKTFGLSLIFRYFMLALSLTDDVFVRTFYDFMIQ